MNAYLIVNREFDVYYGRSKSVELFTGIFRQIVVFAVRRVTRVYIDLCASNYSRQESTLVVEIRTLSGENRKSITYAGGPRMGFEVDGKEMR